MAVATGSIVEDLDVVEDIGLSSPIRSDSVRTIGSAPIQVVKKRNSRMGRMKNSLLTYERANWARHWVAVQGVKCNEYRIAEVLRNRVFWTIGLLTRKLVEEPQIILPVAASLLRA